MQKYFQSPRPPPLFLPVPALLAGWGVFVHQSGEFEQGEFLQQQELGHWLVLHPWTGGQGGQALLAGPVQLLAHSAEHTGTCTQFQHSTNKGHQQQPGKQAFVLWSKQKMSLNSNDGWSFINCNSRAFEFVQKNQPNQKWHIFICLNKTDPFA